MRTGGSGPRLGDLVVTADSTRPGHFTLTQVPGQPQVSLASASAALDVAERLGRTHAVDVWFITGAATRRQRFRQRDPFQGTSGNPR